MYTLANEFIEPHDHTGVTTTPTRHGRNNARTSQSDISQIPPIQSIARQHEWLIDPCGDLIDWIIDNRRQKRSIINDRFDIFQSIAEVLRERRLSQSLERAISLTPFSRTEHARAVHSILSGIIPKDPVERARLFLVYLSMGKPGDRSQFNRGHGAQKIGSWRPSTSDIVRIKDIIETAILENTEPVTSIKRYYQDSTLVCCRMTRYNADIMNKIIRTALREDMALAIIGTPQNLSEWMRDQLLIRLDDVPVYMTRQAIRMQ